MKHTLRGALALIAGMALALPGIANAAPLPPGLSPNTPLEPSTHKVRVTVVLDNQPTKASASSQASYLAQQDALLADWSTRFGVEVRRQFGYLLNGFSAEMPENKIGVLATQPGVTSVTKSREYTTAMDTAGELTSSVQARESFGVDGTGMLVAVIDTGIDAAHQDMRLDDAGAAGAKITTVKAGSQFSLKVPWGHNYADENEVVKDLSGSMHGQHVAGIVAANGGPDADVMVNGRINGIAPNAQLLAMKVFSNDANRSRTAWDDDIIAAIEDSVRLGADVVNMSLGSPLGFDSEDFGIQRAVKTATAEGVLMVISAGNEGLRSSPTGGIDDYYGTLDDGAVGGPSSAESALSVASVENSAVIQSAGRAYWSGGDEADLTFAYSHQAGPLMPTRTELADGGLGKVDELGDVAGKVALIKRGELAFADKIANALAAGAEGILVWNHEAGGDEFINMAGTDGVTTFVGFTGNTAGAALQAHLEAGDEVEVAFTDGVIVIANPDSLRPSSFTSWGSTPTLEFKPNIAGIGGKVYSTLNDNSYGTMSGTSMAAPHVAGASALILQDYADRFPDIARADLLDVIRTSMVNTAQVLRKPDGVPFAPRQMGAGLLNTTEALTTDVFATVDGAPQVALKEITSAHTVSVTLENKGAVPRTFTTSSTVLVEANEWLQDIATHLSGTDTAVANVDTVTVPAGGSVNVEYTITPEAMGEYWLEGWLDLNSTDLTQPSLRVPFLGFVGDWNAEPIVDAPVGSDDAYMPWLLEALTGSPTQVGTQLLTISGDSTYLLGDDHWFSPNGDGVYDTIYPTVALMRQADTMVYEIVDDSGTVVAAPGMSREVSPDPLRFILSGERSGMYFASEGSFDGKAWDQSAAQWTTLPDGRYTYRISARLGDEFAPQFTELPFGIDTLAPELEMLAAEVDGNDAVLTYRFADESSGFGGALGLIGYGANRAEVSALAGDSTFTVRVPGAGADPASAGHVVVYAVDGAGNMASDTHFFTDGVFLINAADLVSKPLNDQSVNEAGERIVTDGAVTVLARVTGSVTQVSLRVNGVDYPAPVDPATSHVAVTIPLTEGINDFEFSGRNGAGDVVGKGLAFDVIYDLTAPVLTLTSPVPGADGLVDAPPGTLIVEGRVIDNIAGWADLTVLVNGETVAVESDGSFSAAVPGPQGRTVVVSASDGVNWSDAAIHLSEASVPSVSLIESITVNLASYLTVLNASSPGITVTTDGAILTISGVLNRIPLEFSIGGAPVDVSADGSFSFDLPMPNGVNDTNFRIVDTDGRIVRDTTVKFLYDDQLPELSIDRPVLREGILYSNVTDVELSGTIQDNTVGYTLAVNGFAVQAHQGFGDLGELNMREWSWSGSVVDGDTLLFSVADLVGNAFELEIPIVIDQVAPDLTIEGLPADRLVTPAVSTPVSVLATDDYLDSLEVILDGAALPVINLGRGPVTALQATFDAGALERGTHTLSAVAVDMAGNESTMALSFLVNAAPVIEGPDSVTIDPDDEWSLEDYWSVSDDEDGATVDADLSHLVLGDNEVVLVATDIHGTTTTRTVHIVLERPLTTLTSACVSMDARFVRGDTLSATCTVADHSLTVQINNAMDPIDGRITVAVTGNVRVFHLVDGVRLPVNFDKNDHSVSFLGSSKGTYIITWPAAPVDPTDPGDPGDGGGGTDPGDGGGATHPGTGGGGTSGGGTVKPGSSTSRPLPGTGSDAEGALALSGALLLGGGALLAIRRRRRS